MLLIQNGQLEVLRAADYVQGALRHAFRPGRCEVAVLNHFWQNVRHGIVCRCLAMTAFVLADA